MIMKITFSNKGGQPKTVELKKYKTLSGQPVQLQRGDFNKISYKINATDNSTAETDNIIFRQELFQKMPIIVKPFHLQVATQPAGR